MRDEIKVTLKLWRIRAYLRHQIEFHTGYNAALWGAFWLVHDTLGKHIEEFPDCAPIEAMFLDDILQ
jgi:hypothetical protein